MEGNNWLYFDSTIAHLWLCFHFKMVRKKEKLLIFIWYVASIAFVSLMIELALGGWEAMIFALIFS